MRKHICGTPAQHCTGGSFQTTKGLHDQIKAHASAEDAFNCYARYLISQGYERVGQREFRKLNEDGTYSPRLVLTRKSRFGASFRAGKSGKVGGEGKRRITPKRRTSGMIIG